MLSFAVRRMSFSLVFSALWVATCSVAAADTNKVFSAEYTFPVADDSLKPFATHKIDTYTVTTTDAGQTIVSFAFPEDLSAGRKTQVAFTEVENDGKERVLKGEAGIIRCTIPWPTSTCQVEFSPSVVPAISDTIDFLVGKYGLDDNWLERMSAVDKFSTEPIGTVRVVPTQN